MYVIKQNENLENKLINILPSLLVCVRFFSKDLLVSIDEQNLKIVFWKLMKASSKRFVETLVIQPPYYT